MYGKFDTPSSFLFSNKVNKSTDFFIPNLGIRVMFWTKDLEPLAVGLLLPVVEVAEHPVVLHLRLELGRERSLRFNLE